MVSGGLSPKPQPPQRNAEVVDEAWSGRGAAVLQGGAAGRARDQRAVDRVPCPSKSFHRSSGLDIAPVRRLLQHSSAATTQRHIGAETRRIEKAIDGYCERQGVFNSLPFCILYSERIGR